MRVFDLRIPLWLAGQAVLATGMVSNALTIFNRELGMALAAAAFGLTFISHDFKGRRRLSDATPTQSKPVEQ